MSKVPYALFIQNLYTCSGGLVKSLMDVEATVIKFDYPNKTVLLYNLTNGSSFNLCIYTGPDHKHFNQIQLAFTAINHSVISELPEFTMMSGYTMEKETLSFNKLVEIFTSVNEDMLASERIDAIITEQ